LKSFFILFFSICQRMKRKKQKEKDEPYYGGSSGGGVGGSGRSGGYGGYGKKREPSPLDLVIDPSCVMERALREPNGITLNWTLSLKLRRK
jgi:hypothetical protein